MKIQTTLYLLVMMSCSSLAQQNSDHCNRMTRKGWEFMFEKIPKTLCLPDSTVLINAYPYTDMNGDGREDVAIQFYKQEFSDGDTLYTAIYFMNQDSSYSLIRRIDKLDVLYYRKRTELYFEEMREKTGNLYLYDTLAGVHAYAPNNKTVFEGAKIRISMEPGVGEKYQFEYTYDPEIQNWKQTEFIIHDEFQNPPIQSIEIEESPLLITDFDITDYM